MEPTGERLKKIRLGKGIALEEVHKKTKVQLNILKAIEGDGLTNLSPVYLKGFLKIYCKFLGVDPNEYIADYKEPSYKLSEKHALKVASPKQEKVSPKPFSIKLPRIHLNKKIISILMSVVILLIIWIILFNLGKLISSKRKNHLVKPVRLAVPSSEQKENKLALVKPKSVEMVPKKEAISGIRLGIRAHENCWVSLKVDGKLVFQRVLQKGRFESWQAKNKIELSVGNAGVVELEVNGQLFSNLGRKGKALKNILITQEGLKIGR